MRNWLALLVVTLLVVGCTTLTAEPTAITTSAPSEAAVTPAPTVSSGSGYPGQPVEPTAESQGYPVAPSPQPGATSASMTPPAPNTPTVAASPSAAGYALRFFGTGRGDVDRVKISLTGPANIGQTDFTLEFWLKANPGDNASTTANCGALDGWITGNIVVDRDVWGAGDYGDFGLSLANGRVVFGIAKGERGTTVCGQVAVTDGNWHHIAITRQAGSGQVRLFVDGKQDGETLGPTGDIRYRVGRSTSYPNDAFLVLGAEKHDYDPTTYPSFRGWLDEMRLSTVVRYIGDFERPRTPFESDADTAALWRFDEGTGDFLGDAAPDNANAGQLKVGGASNGPQWTPSDAPLVVEP